MSISLPTDIVMDVAKAAEPARLQEAVAKLSAPGDPAAFTDSMQAAGLALHMPLDANGSLTTLKNHTALNGSGRPATRTRNSKEWSFSSSSSR